MTTNEFHLDTLRRLAAMPFLDRLELAAVAGAPDRSAYNAVAALERQGLVSNLPHATALLPGTRRFFLTSAGLRRLAQVEGITLEQLLHRHPVNARWRRILLERLDIVAVIYRLTSSIAALEGIASFRWYRGLPLDAGIVLNDGRTVGVVRQGLTADRTGFAKRIWGIKEGELPGGVFLLLPDEVRSRHARRLVAGSPFPALLALERNAAWCGPDSPVWQLPSVNADLDLKAALGHVEGGGGLPAEPPPLRATTPRDIVPGSREKRAPDWLLPTLLKPAGKLVLDLVSDWPWIAQQHLRMLLGISQGRLSQVMLPLADAGLIERVSDQDQRLTLTNRGLAILARRDQASVGVARKRWCPAPSDPPQTPGLAQRLRPAQPPIAQEHRAHRRRSLVHGRPGRPGRAGPLPGLGRRTAGPAPPRCQALSVWRPAAVGSPRRLRRAAEGQRHRGPRPGVGTAGGAAHDDGGPPGPLPAELLDPPAHRRPRNTTCRLGGLRRRPGRDPLPAGGAGGYGTRWSQFSPVGLIQEVVGAPGAAGTRLAITRPTARFCRRGPS